MLAIRRPLAALFALLYLLLAAGGEALEHGASDPAPAHAESHLHAAGEGNHDCPPPPHDETHCPACKLTGLRLLLTKPDAAEFAGVTLAARIASAGDELVPALRSHAPPSSRAPPFG